MKREGSRERQARDPSRPSVGAARGGLSGGRQAREGTGVRKGPARETRVAGVRVWFVPVSVTSCMGIGLQAGASLFSVSVRRRRGGQGSEGLLAVCFGSLGVSWALGCEEHGRWDEGKPRRAQHGAKRPGGGFIPDLARSARAAGLMAAACAGWALPSAGVIWASFLVLRPGYEMRGVVLATAGQQHAPPHYSTCACRTAERSGHSPHST